MAELKTKILQIAALSDRGQRLNTLVAPVYQVHNNARKSERMRESAKQCERAQESARERKREVNG